jgi:hypothetical protein
MRGTKHKVSFGFGAFFLLGGIAMYLIGDSGVLTSDTGVRDTAGDTIKLIGVGWVGVALVDIALLSAVAARIRSREAIALTGVEGTAVVEKVETTTTSSNGPQQYRLAVELRRNDGGETRHCTKRDTVPNTAIGRWGIGTALPVRIDRDDPDDFEILWDDLPMLVISPAGVADELSKLAELSQKGLLSPDEWERAKDLYLGKPLDRRSADAHLLGQLHDLYRDGGLSESEFNTKKWEILSRT